VHLFLLGMPAVLAHSPEEVLAVPEDMPAPLEDMADAPENVPAVAEEVAGTPEEATGTNTLGDVAGFPEGAGQRMLRQAHQMTLQETDKQASACHCLPFDQVLRRRSRQRKKLLSPPAGKPPQAALQPLPLHVHPLQCLVATLSLGLLLPLGKPSFPLGGWRLRI
jgi:hypothetical protein